MSHSASLDQMIRHITHGLAVIALLIAPAAQAQTQSGTLTLDALSFISFQDEELLLLPSGSTLRFDFGAPEADGSIPFTISPGGLSVPEIDVPSLGRSLSYGLNGTAAGVIRPEIEGSRVIEFTGMISATLSGENGAEFVYPISFTTETASATDILGQVDVEVTGLRLVEGVWYAQLVGATTNHENAFPKPGAAVYSVLSGQFDQLPIAP